MAESEPRPSAEPRPMVGGYPAGQPVPVPLGGRTAQQLNNISDWLKIWAVLTALPIAFESWFKAYQPWYGIGFLAAVLIELTVSAVFLFKGRRRMIAELKLGYTTILSIAQRFRGIFLLHPLTKQRVAGPGEERPARIPRSLGPDVARNG